MRLYEIDNAILECIDEETGEVLDFDRLEELQLAREQKIEGVALYIKNLAAAAAEIKAEEAALAERRKAKEAKVARLKEYLSNVLGGQKFETARVSLSFRSSTAVEVSDEELLRCWLEVNNLGNCIKYKTPEIRLSEVGKLLKAGEEMPGAALVVRQNVQVK